MEWTAGIDDAGRGPIIGPLVIGGVALPQDRVRDLVGMGVKDSKLLTSNTRIQLEERIRGLVTRIGIREIQPQQIDDVVFHGRKLRKLNFLEARVMAEVINELRPPEVYVDASDVNEKRFGEDIRSFLTDDLKKIKIISEHHADRNYPQVSAASIIAKVHRDQVIDELHEEYGDFGSGYITDPKTMSFLRAYRQSHDSYPSIVRLSWKTAREIENESAQIRFRS
ncbi:MAG TPA: ribonuclease HII [Methylomirabilota bacterium]|nr:ribonuclease HII [Methylomirabilota bacterium]